MRVLSLASLMLSHMKRSFTGAAVAGIAAFLSVTGCDKVPLTAPTGSVISIFAAANTVPINGDIEIVVTVIENGTTATTPTTPTTPGGGTTTPTTPTSTTNPGAGTPVQNGTVVSFTTTIGHVEPSEARTSNGQVRVRFFAGAQSGVATITAFSGGASGKLENLKVGAAGVERVVVSASPQTVSPLGGTSTITARVEDVSGVGLSGIPVTFTSDNGSLNPATATTDSSGVATTTLTLTTISGTTRAAKVTASVAGKTADVTVGMGARTGVTITGPTTQVSAGLPANFTVGVAAGANIQSVVVDFGDGSSQNLGALSGQTSVPHTYSDAGTFTVRATATDASGFSVARRRSSAGHPAWVAGRFPSGGGPNYSVLDLSSKGSPQCSTSVSLVLTSITMSLISMFDGSTRYFARRSCSLMADFLGAVVLMR